MSTYDQYRLTAMGRRVKSEFGAGSSEDTREPAVYTILDMVDSGSSFQIPTTLRKTVSRMVQIGLLQKIKW